MKRILAVVLIAVSPVTMAVESYGDTKIKAITSIYDGDTFRADISGWPSIVGERMAIRINGIDTPELRAKCDHEKQMARAAKQYTVKALREAKHIELHNMQRGKYFRILADVYVDGYSLGESLINAGLAVPYDGKTKTDWCK